MLCPPPLWAPVGAHARPPAPPPVSLQSEPLPPTSLSDPSAGSAQSFRDPKALTRGWDPPLPTAPGPTPAPAPSPSPEPAVSDLLGVHNRGWNQCLYNHQHRAWSPALPPAGQVEPLCTSDLSPREITGVSTLSCSATAPPNAFCSPIPTTWEPPGYLTGQALLLRCVCRGFIRRFNECIRSHDFPL